MALAVLSSTAVCGEPICSDGRVVRFMARALHGALGRHMLDARDITCTFPVHVTNGVSVLDPASEVETTHLVLSREVRAVPFLLLLRLAGESS